MTGKPRVRPGRSSVHPAAWDRPLSTAQSQPPGLPCLVWPVPCLWLHMSLTPHPEHSWQSILVPGPRAECQCGCWTLAPPSLHWPPGLVLTEQVLSRALVGPRWVPSAGVRASCVPSGPRPSAPLLGCGCVSGAACPGSPLLFIRTDGPPRVPGLWGLLLPRGQQWGCEGREPSARKPAHGPRAECRWLALPRAVLSHPLLSGRRQPRPHESPAVACAS